MSDLTGNIFSESIIFNNVKNNKKYKAFCVFHSDYKEAIIHTRCFHGFSRVGSQTN